MNRVNVASRKAIVNLSKRMFVFTCILIAFLPQKFSCLRERQSRELIIFFRSTPLSHLNCCNAEFSKSENISTGFHKGGWNVKSSAPKTRTNIHQDYLFCRWALPELGCASPCPVPSSFPHLCHEPLPSAQLWRQHSLTHQPALWPSSLPRGSVVIQGVQGSGGQHCCGCACAETAKCNSQTMTKLSSQLRAWKKDQNILQKSNL